MPLAMRVVPCKSAAVFRVMEHLASTCSPQAQGVYLASKHRFGGSIAIKCTHWRAQAKASPPTDQVQPALCPCQLLVLPASKSSCQWQPKEPLHPVRLTKLLVDSEKWQMAVIGGTHRANNS